MEFRWNEWNLEHATKHGVRVEDAAYVVEHARSPYPRRIGGDKWIVWGPTVGGWHLQVIYLEDPDGTAYIIHARPLNDREKRRYRRGKR